MLAFANMRWQTWLTLGAGGLVMAMLLMLQWREVRRRRLLRLSGGPR
jgi:hypothetical protein